MHALLFGFVYGPCCSSSFVMETWLWAAQVTTTTSIHSGHPLASLAQSPG